MTATKKRDVILPTTNSTLDPSIPSNAIPVLLAAGRPTPARTPAYTYCIPWIPTYRAPSLGANPSANPNLLTTGTPYYKGLSENITISTTGGVPWQWRRICFTFKGAGIIDGFTAPDASQAIFNPINYYKNTYGNDTGIFRPLYDLASYYGDAGGATAAQPLGLQKLYQYLFQGTSSQFSDDVTITDWINVMTAKTDSREVNIKYDKTITIASGNEEGVQRNYKRYHSMEKNLYYDSFEHGTSTTYQPLSTDSKPGMGDYYVIDFFQARYAAGADAGNLIFDPRATVYWHEK